MGMKWAQDSNGFVHSIEDTISKRPLVFVDDDICQTYSVQVRLMPNFVT